MSLGPNNSNMQRSQRNLAVGALSVATPAAMAVQTFFLMLLIRWAWRGRRWLLANAAVLALIVLSMAGRDWLLNNAGDRLHQSAEQRPGRIWSLDEARQAWTTNRGPGASWLRTTVIPNLFVYLDPARPRAEYIDPQAGWTMNSKGALIPLWQPQTWLLDRAPLSPADRATVLASVFDALLASGAVKPTGRANPSGSPPRVLAMPLDGAASTEIAKQLAARREPYLLLPSMTGPVGTANSDAAARSVLCASDPAAAWQRAAAAARPGQAPEFTGHGAVCPHGKDLLDIWRMWLSPGSLAWWPVEVQRNGEARELRSATD